MKSNNFLGIVSLFLSVSIFSLINAELIKNKSSDVYLCIERARGVVGLTLDKTLATDFTIEWASGTPFCTIKVFGGAYLMENRLNGSIFVTKNPIFSPSWLYDKKNYTLSPGRNYLCLRLDLDGGVDLGMLPAVDDPMFSDFFFLYQWIFVRKEGA